MTNKRLSAAFSQNRTEELSLDVWNDFVAPRFLRDLDLLSATKPRIVIGGRGCGKTMLLRYYSFESQFSKKRATIPKSAFNNVGLYWRIDTQFASVMNSRGIEDTAWIIAFEHFLVVYISVEILRALRAMAGPNCHGDYRSQIEKLQFRDLDTYGPEYIGGVDSLHFVLQKQLKRFELWVSNVRKVEEPVFLPKTFLSALIGLIRHECPILSELNFHVFVDEFENLLPYQQRVINTHIKHSQQPLIFSVAMKRRGFVTQETLGAESISEINDYRRLDLEDMLLDSDFELFAAEVLLLHLWKVDFKDLPSSAEQLRDVERLDERSEATYRRRVLLFINNLFPGVSEHELAIGIFNDQSLKATLRKKIEKGLTARFGSAKFADTMLDESNPKESIVCSALVYRSRLSPTIIVAELEKRKAGLSSRFDDWVDNNFIGCLLQLYEPNQKICPFYAGFETFTKLSKGNLRHLLELCSKSISCSPEFEGNDLPVIAVDAQARAAKQASAAFLQEVRSYGKHGNRLHAFVLRIGSLFALAHGRSPQSQPEMNHFSIGGKNSISDEMNGFLNEAVKWTVLFETQETKVKGPRDGKQANLEYILHPIYSPYFNISYRKRRRMELTVDEFNCFVTGDYDSVSRLLKNYSRKWDVDLEESSPTLFSHLID